MSEPAEGQPLNLNLHYRLGYDVVFRWAPYRHAVDGRDFHSDIVLGNLALSGDETVADIGCGAGELLCSLLNKFKHTGILLGVDSSPDVLRDAQERLSPKEQRAISLRVGQAESLDFLEDDSVDVLTALFMLYHTDPELAIPEFRRVVKAGGMIVIATSGKRNKLRQRILERRIAEATGAHAPTRFSAHFDRDEADTCLPRYFSSIEQVSHECEMRIPPEHLDDVMNSLHSMRKSFEGDTRGWVRITQAIFHELEIEAQTVGYYTDWIDRIAYFCVNDK